MLPCRQCSRLPGMVIKKTGRLKILLYYSTSCGLRMEEEASNEAVFCAAMSGSRASDAEREGPGIAGIHFFRHEELNAAAETFYPGQIGQILSLNVLKRLENGRAEVLQVTGTLGTVAIEGEYAIRQFLRPGDQAVILQDGKHGTKSWTSSECVLLYYPTVSGWRAVRFSAEWRGIWARGRHESEWCKTPGGRGMELSGNFEVLLWRRSGDHMRYVIQLVCWLLRFMDKSSEDRVDAYSAQSAFFIIWDLFPL